MILRNLDLDGRRVDVRVEHGRVTELGPRLDGRTLLDGHGGALLPGLVDHHVHLHALAARDRSIDAATPDEQELARRLAAAAPDEHGWLRAMGSPLNLDGDALDRLHDVRPVRLAHHGGALWTLNTPAAAAIGLEQAQHRGVERDAAGRPTGRLWRADAWLRRRLPAASTPDLRATVSRFVARGVTAVTDATPDLDDTAMRSLAETPMRVVALGVPLNAEVPENLSPGPYKIVVSDQDLPEPHDLAGRIAAAHGARRPVAVHCVTLDALVVLLAAFEIAGRVAGDRIEHAALIPPELIPELRGLRIVTQPGFLAIRGDDYRRALPFRDHDGLYRVATLRAAHVPVALSSDAPYGPVDPWVTIEAAVKRRTPAGVVLGARERVAATTALDMMLAPPAEPGGVPQRVVVGMAADLVVLGAPLAEVLVAPTDVRVCATLIGGELVHVA